MPFRNVVSFKNAQLAPKPASTDKLTPVTAHSRLKMHAKNSHSTETFNIVWMSFYNTDFATTELAATINVGNKKHDAAITANAAPLANSTPFVPVFLNHFSESRMQLPSTFCAALRVFQ